MQKKFLLGKQNICHRLICRAVDVYSDVSFIFYFSVYLDYGFNFGRPIYVFFFLTPFKS